MANRRTPPKNTASSQILRDSASGRHKYQLRHSPLSRKRDLPDSHGVERSSSRPVLVPLHPNLRRLPSRLMVKLRLRDKSGNGAVQEEYSQVGGNGKRKRVASENENSYSIVGRAIRGPARFKRRKSTPDKNESSDEDALASTQQNAMEVDVESDFQWDLSEQSDVENPEDESDDFLLYEAGTSRLQRLRKDELIRLCGLAGLHDLSESLKKSEIIDTIMSAREDNVTVPPSSPPGPSDGQSSEYSSDDGHEGGGEETDATLANARFSLRRRVTVQTFHQKAGSKAMNGRSLSLNDAGAQQSNKKVARIAAEVASPSNNSFFNSLTRRRVAKDLSSLSSPLRTESSIPSPPATRLRSRTVSRDVSDMPLASLPDFGLAGSSSRNSSVSGRRGKAKQVDFEEEVVLHQDDTDVAPSTPAAKGRHASKNGRSQIKPVSKPDGTEDDAKKRRVTPMRKAKGKVVNLKEESTGEEEEAEEEDVDQLIDSPSAVRRTPVRRRLRPRNRQSFEAPSDGDDEEDDEEEDDDISSQAVDSVNEDHDDSAEVNSGEESTDTDDQEDQLLMTPKKLRNGKIVGEEPAAENESDENTSGEEVDEIDSDQQSATSSETSTEQDIDIAETDSEDADEAMETDIDINAATQKSLVRLRRDDLVRLCEARDITTEGTKADLAEALLKWRDREESSTSAPSSSSTVRPPSTSRTNTRTNGHHRRTKSKSATPPALPVLLRTHRIHLDEPRTPPLSDGRKDMDADLELDLESLGLEDREIPQDKLTKLEKIGSGGFKDVFVGKFKGRKVAIAEFRDQLSPMDIKELKLLAEFQHPNIVRFLGVSIPENPKETPVMIVSELCTNGDLFDYLRNVQPPSLYKVLCMMLDIARGLRYLHERKPSVIHRDCKSSNILITSKGVAKIADFGLAKVKQSTRSMVRSLVGTVNWQAPELWHPHPKYNHKVDVYSCGSVYWEMLQWHLPSKKFPWEGMNEHAIYEAVGTKKQRPPVTGLRKQWCPEIVDLIEKMWAQDPQDRPGIADVVEELEEIIRTHR